jgi:S-formylglutathione hydrolase
LGIQGEDDGWDFGTGAGFYVDATQEPWAKGYKMYSYIAQELPEKLFKAFPQWLDGERVSITGHSMGGHGALTIVRMSIVFDSADRFSSCGTRASTSRVRPLRPSRTRATAPGDKRRFRATSAKTARSGGTTTQQSWFARPRGRSTFSSMLYVSLNVRGLTTLTRQGTEDNFYKQGQLLPENFVEAAKQTGHEGITLRKQPGYDHSYYFVSSFADDHVAHARKYLFKE